MALGDDSANNRSCFSSFHCYCDKIPSKTQLEGGRDGYRRRFEKTQSVMTGKVRRQGQKAAGHAGSAAGKQKERFCSSAGSLLSLFILSAIPSHKIVVFTSRVCFPFSVKPPENTSIDTPEVYSHGASKSNQGDNEDQSPWKCHLELPCAP